MAGFCARARFFVFARLMYACGLFENYRDLCLIQSDDI